MPWAVLAWGFLIPSIFRGQAGFIAMLRAVDSYDPSRGTKFSTYLFHRLRAELSAATGYNSKRSWFDPLQSAVSLDAPLDRILI